MKNTIINITLLRPSKTNMRPAGDFKGPAFGEFVASVKEKGVLVPVLVRPLKRGGKNAEQYEVVAGHRRLAAAKEAGLKSMPAHVVEMTDDEAREAQIIENLQREDVHPLDEAAALKELYGPLSKKTGATDAFGMLATRVGKSERYVRDRILLTELDTKVAAAVRTGELPLSHAVVIARLPGKDQVPVYKKSAERQFTLSELKRHVADNVFMAAMKSPPWKDDAQAKAEIAKAVGVEGGEKNLFGESAIEAFEDAKQYALAVAAWISLKIGEYKRAGKPLTLVSGEYHTSTKGILSTRDYKTGKGFYASARVKCKSGHDALIVEGDGIGKLLKICTDKKCPAHNYFSEPEKSPEARAAAKQERKKEIEREKAKRDADTKACAAAVAKMSWPLSEKHLAIILGLALRHASHDVHMQVAKRRAVEVEEERTSWGKRKDYEESILKYAAGLTAKEKAGLLFELLVPAYSTHYSDGRGAAFKKLSAKK